ncbi:sensor domain-containing diguanylate cyclase [Moorella sulfitireducens]|uniref:sensor domain-containing diguanylate cyclase n=1 Tax=Neomoorella sulfitireducens TaxID=2972948 RepID=UPI0021ACE20B|nr:GGDEF domain-containing protein [Moorella sulfitireducens]
MPRPAALIIIATVLYLIARVNYLIYHTLVELFSVVVAFLIFTISWLIRDQEHDMFPSVIGVGYAFIGFFDLLHTIAYKGMGIFAATGANLATQLWISGRLLEAFVLLTAPFVQTRRARQSLWFIYALYSSLVLTTIFWWRIFPTCYIEGSGLTPFKIITEYAIICILLLTLYILKKHEPALPGVMVNYLSYSILTTIASEFCFTLYVNVYDLANFTGHLLKVASYYLLFTGIVEKCIREPLANLYRRLQADNLRLQLLASLDSLTGLLNRGALMLLIPAGLEKSRTDRVPFSLMMIDIDHFKLVNDTYGHQVGDIVLKELAGLILKAVRSREDIVGRYGGEEFIVAMGNANANMARIVAERIRRDVEKHVFGITSGHALKVTVSLGIAEARKGETVEGIIDRADQALYLAKARGRNRTEVAL